MSSAIEKLTGYAFYISKSRNSTKRFPDYDNTLFPYTLKFLNKEMAQDIIKEFGLYGDPEDKDYKNEVNNALFTIEQEKIDKFQTYLEMIGELEVMYEITIIKTEIPVKIPFESQRRIAEKFMRTKRGEVARISAFLKGKPTTIENLTMAIHNEAYAQVLSYMFVYDGRVLTKGTFEEELHRKIDDKNDKSPLYITGVAELTIVD